MFICNLKVNGSKLGKIFLGILFAIIIIITIIVIYRILGNNFFKTNDNISSPEVQELTTANYTNVLQTVHNNIDEYIGLQIKFSGYIYRMIDFNQNQFVLARDMVISSDFQTVVVGFLCECEDIKQYEDCTWIEVEGKITKGSYHGDMPIVKVEKIQRIDKPSDEYVYPPDESFVPTMSIL
ncbi:MAG: hypothetical protein ACI4UU_04895 [Clostridia bacterium]